jgi:hypothetical protein
VSEAHILVADSLMPAFDLERRTLERAGVTWCLPSGTPPPREQQREELLASIAKAPRMSALIADEVRKRTV